MKKKRRRPTGRWPSRWPRRRGRPPRRRRRPRRGSRPRRRRRCRWCPCRSRRRGRWGLRRRRRPRRRCRGRFRRRRARRKRRRRAPPPPRPPALSSSLRYKQSLKPYQVDSAALCAGPGQTHVYMSEAQNERVVPHKRRVRVAKELGGLPSSLPLEEGSAIFVRVDEANSALWRFG